MLIQINYGFTFNVNIINRFIKKYEWPKLSLKYTLYNYKLYIFSKNMKKVKQKNKLREVSIELIKKERNAPSGFSGISKLSIITENATNDNNL